jgi:hypothetical protein
MKKRECDDDDRDDDDKEDRDDPDEIDASKRAPPRPTGQGRWVAAREALAARRR